MTFGSTAPRLDLDRHAGPAPGPGILIGLSGGADSVALLHLLARGGWRVEAAHLDHGARPGSAEDAAWVADLCAGLGVALHMERAAIAPGPGFEARARDARLAFLARTAAARGLPAIALAHHRDDQAETVLFRLARGSGPDGLAGMRPARALAPGVRLLRPLLGVPRADLRAWLAAEGLGWREDPTNADPAFAARNRLRHAVLPALGPGAAERIAALADLLADEREAREEQIASMANHYMAVVSPGIGEVDRRAFNALPIAQRRQLLRLLASRMGGAPPDSHGVALAVAAAEKGGASHLGGGWRIDVDPAWVALSRDEAPGPPPAPLAPSGPQPTAPWGWRVALRTDAAPRTGPEPAGPCLARFAPETLPPDPVWRSADPDGDRFRPWGRDGAVSLRRWLTRQGVPRHRQTTLLVLASGRDVLWIPGYGRSALAPVAEDTLNALEMHAGAVFRF